METREIITLDGIKTEIVAADLDGDGVRGGIETINQRIEPGVQNIVTPTEIGESLKELHNDILDTRTRMSGIDMRAYLHYAEVASVLALDSLVALGVLPTKTLAFSRQKKRLSKSIDGIGSKQIVDLVAGKRELEARTSIAGGIGEKFKSFFGGGNGGMQQK